MNWLKTNSQTVYDPWTIGGSRVGFGLGSIQWTFSRSFTLINLYLEANSYSSSITMSQATQAEAKMILTELSGAYSSVCTNWLNQNSGNFNSQAAAYNAGSTLCLNYEKPSDMNNKAIERGNLAKEIYSIMTN